MYYENANYWFLYRLTYPSEPLPPKTPEKMHIGLPFRPISMIFNLNASEIMPRKSWPLKNQYCKRCKLTEEEFERLVENYFREATTGAKREYYIYPDRRRTKNYHEMLRKSWATGTNYRETPIGRITRQVSGRYYKKLGDYIWNNFVVKGCAGYENEGIFDDLISLIYGGDYTDSFEECELYKCLQKGPFYINKKKPLINSLLFYLLLNRTRMAKGIKKEHFYLEFSRIYFICAISKDTKVNLSSIYTATTFGDASIDLNLRCQYTLLHILKSDPL